MSENGPTGADRNENADRPNPPTPAPTERPGTPGSAPVERSQSLRPQDSNASADPAGGSTGSRMAGRAADALEASGGPSATKRDGTRKGAAETAGAAAAMAAGAPAPVAGVAGAAASKGIKFGLSLAAVFSIFLTAVLLSAGNGGVDRDSHYGTAQALLDGNDERMPAENLRAYQSAARKYNNQAYGGPVPWSLIAAIAQLTTEHGKLSPYSADTCDRDPQRPSASQQSGAYVEPQTTVADDLADSETEDDCTVGTFPVVAQPIGDAANGEGLGPFLILPQALTGKHSDVDPQRVDDSGSGENPTSATTFIAYELDRIRTEMIEVDGLAPPTRESSPDGDSEAAAQYASEFWGEAVSRLPLADPRNASCDTPQPGNSDTEISAAVMSVWRCEMLRAGETFTYALRGDEIVQLGAIEGIDTVVREALDIAWVFSNFGDRNSYQGLCGRVALNNGVAFSGTTQVTVVGDSLTVGVDGKVQAMLAEAGVPAGQIRVDARQGRSTRQGAAVVKDLAPTGGVVVAALGTNDYSPQTFSSDIDLFMSHVPGTVPVVWYTIDRPDAAAAGINAELRSATVRHSNMTVVDWKSFIDSRSELRASDDIHLTFGTGGGYEARAAFIVSNLPGGSSDAVRPPLVGGREPRPGDLDVTAAPDDVPVGVFPLTKQMFDEFNPTAGASRCDFGPNIHAAVNAFIAGERIDRHQRRDLVERESGKDFGEFNAMVGGWWAMPWVLGDGPELVAFLQDGPRRPFIATDECRALTQRWVAELAELDDFAEYLEVASLEGTEEYDEKLRKGLMSLLMPPLAWEVTPGSNRRTPPSPAATQECGNRTGGEVELLAANMASMQRLSLNSVQRPDAEVSGDAGQDDAPDDIVQDSYNPPIVRPSGSQAGVTPDTDDEPSTETPDATPNSEAPSEEEGPTSSDPELLALQNRLEGVALWLRDLVAASPQSALGPPVAGKDVAIGRFSPSGRSIADTPSPGISQVPFSEHVTEVAVAFGGVIADDPRFDVEADPFLVVAAVTSVGLGGGFAAALAGVPASLLDAVNRAIAEAPSRFPECKIDAAFLLANAKAETGPWWDRIGADGTMVPALKNEWTAMGPFQFIEVSWPSYAYDGDGDGDMDPQNTYDAAAAAVKYQCEVAARFDGDLVANPDTEYYVSSSYHFGTNGFVENADRCRAEGHIYKGYAAAAGAGCRSAAYGHLRVTYAAEYREMIARSSLSYYGPGGGQLGDRAVEYAMAQVGKRYCRDDYPGKCSVPVRTLNSQVRYVPGGVALRDSLVLGGGNIRMGPDAFDCSGLVTAAYLVNGHDIGEYVSHWQYMSLPPVPESDLRPGDLLFYDYKNAGRVGHVIMYAGNGMIVHASGHSRGVVYEPLDMTFRGFVGAGRPSLMSGAPA